MYKVFFKPLFDFLFSTIVFLLLSPILVIFILALSIVNKGKPFFFQERPGKDGDVFKIIKLKTMNDKTDKNGELLPDIERITKVGAFVRKYSLDEIPQLINIIKGDMSFIGPRPLLKKYLPLYNESQKRRHHVKPGLTGWAQVNGRNTISWSKRFEYDVWYVDNLSFTLDLYIFWRTIKKVFLKEGVNADNNMTMEAFRGNEAVD